MLLSLAEALERYSSCTYDEAGFLWATANELADEAVDLDTLPRCSPAERAHPSCPIGVPDRNVPIRWVRGVSLLDQRPRWVPAIMTYLHLPFAGDNERFWLPISTGCAAHVDLCGALVNAICEIVERDAISLVWLQQLPLPRIEIDEPPEDLRQAMGLERRGGVRTSFLDATTDLGIPTVYTVEQAPDDPRVTTLVMWATDLDPAKAATKVLREAAASRIALVRRVEQEAEGRPLSAMP